MSNQENPKYQVGAMLAKNDYGTWIGGVIVALSDDPYRPHVCWFGALQDDNGTFTMDWAEMADPKIERLAWVKNCRYQGHVTDEADSRYALWLIAEDEWTEYQEARKERERKTQRIRAQRSHRQEFNSLLKDLQKLPPLDPKDYPETA